jgi:hypothetical protein
MDAVDRRTTYHRQMTTAEAGQHLRNRHFPVRTGAALLALLSFTSTACTTVHRVPTSELPKLNGFHDERSSLLSRLDPRAPPADYHLIDEKGRGHVFDASSRLVLDVRTPGGRERIEARYRQITVEPELFIGLERDSSREVRVPLVQVERVGLRKFSAGQTAGLLVGIAGTGLLILVIVAATLPSSSGSSHHDWD